MKVALTAPTSFGHKPVEYVVVRDRDTIREIGACKRMGGSQINGADVVVVVMVKTADKREAEFWIEDGAIASAYILLAVEQYGLGACWVHRAKETFEMPEWQELLKSLGLEGEYEGIGNLALGYADCEYPAKKERLEGRIFSI
jgi:nitroreductase